MKIIADSGSTKCDWMCLDTGHPIHRTRGINASIHSPEQIRGMLDELSPEVQATQVIFYGAGCGESFPAATQALRELLTERFGTPNIEVHSDLLGAARALLGRTSGIACILGTGSNSCYYNGQRIVHNVPSLGYVLGDEGSGSVMGRKLLNGLICEAFGTKLRDTFYDTYGLDYEGVIHRVYREPQANRFLASLTPFIREHLDAKGMRELVCKAFAEFAERNLSHYPQAEVSFTGGIAAAFEPELRSVMTQCGYKVGRISASPAEGLIEYHERE